MRCEAIMKTEVECVRPDDTAEEAARRMRDENIGFLPVCDGTKKALGTLTDRDIAIRLVSLGKPSTTPVVEIMTHEVITCRPEDDLKDAERLMAQFHKSRMMCVDDAGCVVGIISLSDIAQHERSNRTADTLRSVTEREIRA